MTASTLRVNRRLSHHLQFQAGYTLAWNRDDESGERVFNREGALDPLLPELDAGPSKNDIRHNLRLSGILDLPHGFTISAITLNRSAAPFTPTIGFDTQNDGNDDNDRAIINGHVAGRNSMRGSPFSDLDMRISEVIPHGRKVQAGDICRVLQRHAQHQQRLRTGRGELVRYRCRSQSPGRPSFVCAVHHAVWRSQTGTDGSALQFLVFSQEHLSRG